MTDRRPTICLRIVTSPLYDLRRFVDARDLTVLAEPDLQHAGLMLDFMNFRTDDLFNGILGTIQKRGLGLPGGFGDAPAAGIDVRREVDSGRSGHVAITCTLGRKV